MKQKLRKFWILGICVIGAAISVQSNPTKNVYFGDLHVHTRYSFDAYIFGTRAGPDEAYRFAKGEPIDHVGGFQIKIDRPLDFYAVTDHAFFLGMLDAMEDPGHPMHKHRTAKRMRTPKSNTQRHTSAFWRYYIYLRMRNRPEDAISAWQKIIESANRHYVPGEFTTFVAYEYSASYSINRGNLHRNVIFRGSEAPREPFSRIHSRNPEKLWEWMDKQREKGYDSLAIPHNSNASDGRMFEMQTRRRRQIDESYIALRARNEPLVELTQIKGTSETHPQLSPNDEWANFEIHPYQVGNNRRSKVNGSYVREAWINGLTLQSTLGNNPYALGAIGSSDTHNAAETFIESKYVGSRSHLNDAPNERGSLPLGPKDPEYEPYSDEEIYASSAGLAAVWAHENTREALFDSLRSKETYATTGSRIVLRFLAGYDLDAERLGEPSGFDEAYRQNVPMGGSLKAKTEHAPSFFVWALKDPDRNNLERVQIIKGWLDHTGAQHERVFDVACASDAPIDPQTHRCTIDDVTQESIDCGVDSTESASELRALWTDPSYQANELAFYYVRVLETPSCRWSTWDALRNNVPPDSRVPAMIQERAWSSPVWLEPVL